MKKLLVSIIIAAFIAATTTTAYATETGTLNITDISEHWAKDSINRLIELDIVNGYLDGTFKPDATLKFEEFIKMLVTATEKEKTEVLQGENWYQNYIDIALKKNYITKDMKTLVGSNINRKTVAEIIYNIMAASNEGIVKLSPEELSYINRQFTDLNESEIKILNIARLGILNGYTDKSFKPDGNLSRAESATVILRIIDKSVRTPMEIKQEDITASDKLREPNISVVFDPSEISLLKISINNLKDYIPQGELRTKAQFKIEFPELPELYYVQSISPATGEEITLQAANEWKQLAEDSNYIYLLKTSEFTTQKNKEKVAKILINGYKLKYIITVKDIINEVEVSKKVEGLVILNYKGSLSMDW